MSETTVDEVMAESAALDDAKVRAVREARGRTSPFAPVWSNEMVSR
ncbi:hypothetical protein [Nocardiopsis oceani]